MELKEGRAVFNIERKEAAAMLGVTMRTIDRYIRSGRLAHKKVGYNVFLSRDELDQLIHRRAEQIAHFEMYEHQQEARSEGATTIPVQYHESSQQEDFSQGFETLVYKSLYEGTKKELAEKQQEVEVLQYRLGKLELELSQTVPLLTYSDQQKQKEEEVHRLVTDITMTKQELEFVRREQVRMGIEKMFYVGLVLLLMLSVLVLASVVAFS